MHWSIARTSANKESRKSSDTQSVSKERCMEVLKDFCGAYEEECYTVEFFDQSAQAQRPATYRKNIVYQFPEK